MDIRVHRNPYHVALIRSHLTHKFPIIFDAMRDEIIASFNDNVSLRANGRITDFSRLPPHLTIPYVIQNGQQFLLWTRCKKLYVERPTGSLLAYHYVRLINTFLPFTNIHTLN